MISHGSHPSTALLLYSQASILPRWKRALDLALCLFAAPVVTLITLVIATWIKAVSPGSVLFTQERVGYKGRRFRLYKFRTMHAGAETNSHREHLAALIKSARPMQKLDAARDPRVMAGGWLLRATGLDELPQLINVLRGDMSIVGPRPCIPYEYEQYSAWQRRRFASVPGLTGLWQVSGKNRTTFDEMIRFDITYAERKSLWLDLSIIARTLPALWTQLVDTHLLRRARQNSHRAASNAGRGAIVGV